MVDAATPPAPTGFILDRVYHPRQICAAEQARLPEPKADEFNVGWDWRWLDRSVFEVVVTVSIVPRAARPERIEVVTVGRFRLTGSPTSVQVAEFARINATAILFPYTRSTVASLTASGAFGTLMLPPLNVVEAARTFDPAKATAARMEAMGRPAQQQPESGV